MNILLRIVCKAILIAGLFIMGWVLAVLLFSLIHSVLEPKMAWSCCNRIKKRWLKVFGRILGLNVSVSGQAGEGPAVVVCNHISWLDIIALGQLMPGYFVAKSDILGWPLVGIISERVGTVFVRRGDKQAIHRTTEQMSWLLKQGSKVIAFPEGTTSDGSAVLPFHSSLLQPALLTHSAVQPIAIRYTGPAQGSVPFINDDAFLPHLFKLLKYREIGIEVSVLPLLDSKGKSRQHLCQESRQLILAEVLALPVISEAAVPTPVFRNRL